MIGLEEYKKRYYQAFFNKEIVEQAFNILILGHEENIQNKDEEIERIKNTIKVLEESGTYSKEKLADKKEYATEKCFIEINSTFIKYYQELKGFVVGALEENSESKYKRLAKYKGYKAYIDYFVKGKELETEEDPSGFYDFFCYYSGDYLKQVADIVWNEHSDIDNDNEREKRLRVSLNANFRTTGFSRDFVEYLKTADEHKSYFRETLDVDLWLDLQEYILNVLERQELESSKIKEIDVKDEDNKTLFFEQVALPLEYNDTATLTETSLINGMATTSLDKRTLEDLKILKTFDFKLNSESTEESQKELLKLTELDRFVLDTIVVDFYHKKNIKTFSDRQIATQYTEEKGQLVPPESVRNEINNSILKLQNIRIKLDYSSVQKLKNKNVNVKMDNPLIWLKSIEIGKDTTSNYYEIIDVPFYLTYLIHTDSIMIDYSREILYRQIKGMDKSEKNQDLKHYLVRRLAVMQELPTDIYISVNDIYDVQKVNAAVYPKPNNLKKARQRARDNAELVLKELKKDYEFNYSKDNRGSTIKGFKIMPKR